MERSPAAEPSNAASTAALRAPSAEPPAATLESTYQAIADPAKKATHLWSDLIANFEQWTDLRAHPDRKSEDPDFRHRLFPSLALRLEGEHTPKWVAMSIPTVEPEQPAPTKVNGAKAAPWD